MRSIFRISDAMHHLQDWGAKKSVRSTRIITALGLVIALSVTSATVGLIAWRKHEALDRARVEIKNVSSLVALQTNHAFQAVQVTQRRIAEQIRAANIETPGDLRKWAELNETIANLKFSTDAVSALSSLGIVDERGNLMATSRDISPHGINVSDRVYFNNIKMRNEDTAISGRTVSRLTGLPAIFFAKKITNSQGQMFGAILASIDISEMETSLADITLGDHGSIALVREDGEIITNIPEKGALSGEQNARLSRVIQNHSLSDPAKSSVVKDAIDGNDGNILHVSALSDFPLVVISQVSKASILSQWYNEAVLIGTLAVLLDITIAIAGGLGLRQLRMTQKVAQAQAYAARHDSLTGLPNRLFLQEHLQTAFIQAHRRPEKFALFLLDLDRFKDVNDTYGHQAGDALLKAVAHRLQIVGGPDAQAVRLGGDEFAVVLSNLGRDEDIETCSARLLAAMRQPVQLRDKQISIGASIGAAIALQDADNFEELFDRADLALYKAKAHGRDQVFFYSGEVEACHQDRLHLLQDLRDAIANCELELFFQPILNLASRRIVAFEALLRWNHPTRGFVTPGRFIPLAEESGLMGPLGRWVTEEACRQAQSWPEEIGVAVNLSPVQLQTCDIYAEIRTALQASGLSARRLELEITESVHLEQDGAGDTLRRLRDLGVRIALDDFGTGYASLSYLRSFPFDRLKIDQSFVREMQRSKECSVIVQTVLDLSHRLELSVTAEGVETLEQLNMLRAARCTTAQGYLIGHPLTAGDVKRFLELWRYPGSDRVRAIQYAV